jgi:hypothetical protein
MNKFRLSMMGLAIMAFTLFVFSAAQAQATRTWVSGVGDDVNPCSRTAPCKTFAGAISKTAVDGEINALDPAGFGAVTITKAITIDGSATGTAGILAAGTTGINVNLTVNSGSNFVQLRNLSINGASTGINGIRILSGNVAGVSVSIEKCVIWGFRASGLSSRGISDERSNAGNLLVQDSLIKNNTGSGIVSIGTGAVTTVVDNTTCELNGGTGMVASGANKTMVIRNSVAYKNTLIGMGAEAGAKMDITDSLSSFNATGIDSNAAGTEVRVSRTRVSRNTVNGLGFAGGSIFSFGNSEVSGNAGNNGPFTAGGPVLQ